MKMTFILNHITFLSCWISELGSIGSFIGGIGGVFVALWTVNVLKENLKAQRLSIDAIFTNTKIENIIKYLDEKFEVDLKSLIEIQQEIKTILDNNANIIIQNPVFISPFIILRLSRIIDRIRLYLIEAIALEEKDSFLLESLSNHIRNTEFLQIVNDINRDLVDNPNPSSLTINEERQFTINFLFISQNIIQNQ